MAEVFISWSSPDQYIVNPVVDRLRQAGYSVDEYSADPVAGSTDQMVNGYIERAQIALFFVSARSAGKPWIQIEADWCQQLRVQRTGSPGPIHPYLMPVLIGNVPTSDLPHHLQSPDLRRFNIADALPSEGDMCRLVEGVGATLRLKIYVIPVALLAMTRAQAEALFDPATDPDPAPEFARLCHNLGMEKFPQLRDRLLERYGAIRDDFKPFGDVPLKQLINETVGQANALRRERDIPRLFLWWCTDELQNDNSPDYERCRELWQSRESILVVDSAALLHREIEKQLPALPAPRNSAQSALLWVPPYTRHTTQLASLIEASLRTLPGVLNSVRDKYRQYLNKNDDPYLAFDIGTEPSLRRWFFQAFTEMGAEIKPAAGRAEEMQLNYKTNVPTFFTAKSQARN